MGTARTALLAWLDARAHGGAFVLRVEDLDAPRVRPGAAAAMLEDLRWLGLDWDEGPDVGGPHAPYVQSERRARYDEAIVTLSREGHLFRCTCSRKEIESIASAPHGPDGPVYPGTCREAPSHPEREAALRFRLAQAEPFLDRVKGLVHPDASSDFVVRRADGVHSYQLAVTLDDLAMEITDVVRGEDLLTSTPRQIALARALPARDHTPLRYAHVPLVLGPDGERLAKRHGAPSIAEARAAGVKAEQIVGALAHGCGLVSKEMPIAAQELVQGFSLTRASQALTRSGPQAPASRS